MNVAELRTVAERLNLTLPVDVIYKKDIVPLIKEAIANKAKAAQENARDRSASRLPGGRVDYEAFRTSLLDMAHTTDKFFVAKEAKGDYHENFDSLGFFKWMVATELTYPDWCKEAQAKLDAHKAGTKCYPFFKDNEKAFWEVNSDGVGRPARELIMIMDNAPYHKGIQCQLGSKTKEEIGNILRQHGIEEIRTTRKNGDHMNYEVPSKGTPWKHGDPTAEELRVAALQASKSKDPFFDKPPYEFIVKSKKGQWGPEDSPGWSIIPSAPYVSAHIAVELKWAVGKNHVANPVNHIGSRKSLALITSMLRNKWYNDDNAPLKWFQTANSYELEDIKEDMANDPDCPFINANLKDLGGFGENDIIEWKRRCSMDLDGIDESTNDTAFGEVDRGGDDSENT